MFGSIFFFEVKRWFKSVSTYIYFFILFAIGYLMAISAAGTFPGVTVQFGGEKIFANAPIVADIIISGINSYVGIIIIVAIIGNSVLKDFSANTYSLIFTTPVSKFNYLFGRYFASLFIALIVLTGPALGMMLGYAMPFVDASKVEAFNLITYVNNFWQTTIPNALFAGAIFFAVSLISRDIFVIWLALIVLFIGLGISNSLLHNLEQEKIAAIADPFGTNAKDLLTKYWSIDQSNHAQLPLNGYFLINRLIWIVVSFILLIVGYNYFSFTSSPRVLLFKKRRIAESKAAAGETTVINLGILPRPHQSFFIKNYLINLWGLSVNECRTLLRNTYFRIILLFGIVLLFLVSTQIGKIYDTKVLPVTYEVIQYLGNTFSLFITVLTIIFSGELVWKSRDYKMSNILDALPVPNWVYYVSKVVGLMFMQVILLLVLAACGILIQTFRGYTHYELMLYIEYLFGFRLINLWLFAVIAVFVQVLVSNKYVGYFITAIFYIWNYSFAILVLKHHEYVFGTDPGYIYSDMNGFGHAVFPYFIFKLYWGALAIAIAALSSMWWARGTENRLRYRMAASRWRTARSGWVLILVCGVVFITCGSFIYYNTNVKNKFYTEFQQEEKQATYERRYKKYEHIPQPKITSVQLAVDIYPAERSLHTKGVYILKNKSNVPIDSVHILTQEDIRVNKMDFSVGAHRVLFDNECHYSIYKLAHALQPGDSMSLTFDVSLVPKGFKDDFTGLQTPLYNGTFMNNWQLFPHIGYSADEEIKDNQTRKKHHLAYRRTANPINDSAEYNRNLFVSDADFINFDATLSTSPDQIAIAPGYLQREWTENGRRYFHYKMDSPIINFYAFMSGRYQVKREKWNNINLEIYYHKGHEYNLNRMFNAIKKALQYYTTQFNTYQHKQVRIIEFPRYETFAQSFPNTIPFSEGLGFIADVDDSSKTDVDYPFQVTAHEVAHQWFAHQVIGANVEGSNMLSESLAQYASIMALENEYGDERLGKFLRIELDKYLTDRSSETDKERPLALVSPDQGYILYQKGGYVLHGLNKYIGQDSLNHAIRRFIAKYAFHGAPYPTTQDLVAEIRKSTPDSLQYLVTDIFDKIIIYNNKIDNATVAKTADGKYAVTITIDGKKLSSTGIGKETPIPFNDYVQVAVFSSKKQIASMGMYKIKQGTNKLTIVTNENPYKVAIDPHHLLIDKGLDDNEKRLENNIAAR